MSTQPTLDEWAASIWPKSRLRPLTLRDYQAKYRLHIAPVFGERVMAEIEP